MVCDLRDDRDFVSNSSPLNEILVLARLFGPGISIGKVPSSDTVSEPLAGPSGVKLWADLSPS